MNARSARQAAIEAIVTTSPAGGIVDYRARSIQDVYGEHVFNEDVRRERLPRPVFEALQSTIETGAELTADVADAIAVAMKDWAVEHGATHFTHWFQPSPAARSPG